MSKHSAGSRTVWWPRVLQVMASLILLTGQAAKVAYYLRQIIR